MLDQTGTLLSGAAERRTGAGLDAQQLQYVHQVEAGYAKRIIDCSSRSSAATTCAPRVTAEIDFSQTEATSEEFKPNQGADAEPPCAASRPPEVGSSGARPPSGVPGAASNQPPQRRDRAAHRRRPRRCRPRSRRRARAATSGATASPTTRSTRRCA